jgi:hypothetical protein
LRFVDVVSYDVMMAVPVTNHESLTSRRLDWRKVALASVGLGLIVGMLFLMATPFLQRSQQPKVSMPTNPADPRPQPPQPQLPSKPDIEGKEWFDA